MATGPGLAMKMTADTVGISRGITKTEKMLLDLSKSTRQATSALRGLVAIEVGKMFAGAVSSVSGFVDNVRTSAGELTKLAAISNTSIERFQGLAVAAKTVGFEQDKLADIFKDVGDRVGDFLQTGGGPMADFFENIAPKVGVTAEQFARLSGPEALQLYVSSLEKAGLSQAEMTFYLEAMSSDLTAMLPLLRDGGAGMDDLAARAERLGITLSTTQIDAIKEMNASLSLVYDTFESIIGQVTANLAPVVTAISEEFLAFVEAFNGVGGQGATGIAEVLTQGLLDFADMLAGLFDMLLSGLGETFSDFDASASAFAGFISILEAFGRTIQTVFLSFQNVGLAIGGFLAGIAEFFGVEGAREYGAEVAKLQEQTRRQAEAAAFGIGEAGARIAGGGGGDVGPLQQFLRDMTAEREAARRESDMAAAAAAVAAAIPAAGEVPAGMTAAEQEYAAKLEKLQKELAESTRKAEEERQKKLTSLNENYAEESAKIEEERLDKLAAVNQKALEASDIRSGGISQVLAMATGREDPAVAEARKQNSRLEEIRNEIRNLGGTVEIMGAA